MNTMLKSKFKTMAAILLLLTSVTIFSCEKDEHTPPNIDFKTGTGYTSADATVGQSEAVLIGVNVEKTEDELSTFDVSVSLDGAANQSIAGYPETIGASEEDGFSRDITVTTRAQAGTEKYTFTVTDRDGNITQEAITLTVQ